MTTSAMRAELEQVQAALVAVEVFTPEWEELTSALIALENDLAAEETRQLLADHANEQARDAGRTIDEMAWV